MDISKIIERYEQHESVKVLAKESYHTVKFMEEEIKKYERRRSNKKRKTGKA